MQTFFNIIKFSHFLWKNKSWYFNNPIKFYILIIKNSFKNDKNYQLHLISIFQIFLKGLISSTSTHHLCFYNCKSFLVTYIFWSLHKCSTIINTIFQNIYSNYIILRYNFIIKFIIIIFFISTMTLMQKYFNMIKMKKCLRNCTIWVVNQCINNIVDQLNLLYGNTIKCLKLLKLWNTTKNKINK